MDSVDALVVVPQAVELAALVRACERVGYPGSVGAAGRLECIVIAKLGMVIAVGGHGKVVEPPEPKQGASMAQPLSDLLTCRVARFTDRRADWDAFADARVEGYRRAQYRVIGSGASGKADASVIPAEHFTLSVMFVPPGQGNAPHTHEVEEVFFILRGTVKVFLEDGAGSRAETVLGPWDCVSCPADVIHGFENVGLEPAYLQVMLGKARPDLMAYTDASLQKRRDEHLQPARPGA